MLTSNSCLHASRSR